MLLLLLLLCQDEAAVRTRQGDLFQGRAAGALTLRTPHGTFAIPLADVESIRPCRLREAEVLKLRARAAELAKKGDVEEIVKLGPLALDEIRRVQDTLDTKSALALNAAIDRLEAAGAEPAWDEVRGPDFRLRGWIDAPGALEVATRHGTLKIKLADLASYRAEVKSAARGALAVVCRDGCTFRADLKTSLTVGGKACEDVTGVTFGKTDVVRTKGGRVSGTIEEKEITLASPFGEVKIAKGDLRELAGSAWEPGSKSPLTATGYVAQWLVIGAFNEPEDSGLTREFLGKDAESAPAEGEKLGGRVWRSSAAGEGDVDFMAVTGADEPASGNDIFYACVYVWSADDWSGKIGLNSDDGIRIWVNGALAHDHHEHRGRGLPGEDQDTAPATLRAGWNVVLVKVDNGGGPTGFSLRFLEAKSLFTTIERPPSLQRP